MDPSAAREAWLAIEPVHAVVYFAPEAKPAYETAGLKGGWMGYFASRAAAMGPVPAEVVIATFYNFHPAQVRRAIPDAWRFAPPDRVLAARLEVADRALRRLLGPVAASPAVARASALLRRATEGLDPAGRPLFAAHASLGWPGEGHLALWHGATLVREHRGDGHVASLLAEGVDGCEANVLAVARGATTAETQRHARWWSEEEWAAAEARLLARGWLEPSGGLSEAGWRAVRRIEDRTDALALPPLRRLEDTDRAELLDIMRRLAGEIVLGGGVPFPNAMALPPPRGR